MSKNTGLMERRKSAFDGASSSGTTSTSYGGKDFDWGTAAAVGAQLVGSLITDRGARRANEMTQQDSRESILANRENNRESNMTDMQRDQDTYARTIMRNRAAISPYRSQYSGPAFPGANPDAPIYNPLMDPNHMFNTRLSQAPIVADPNAKPPKKPGKK